MVQKAENNRDATSGHGRASNQTAESVRAPYLHAGGTQNTPPVPVQAEHKGVGQAVQRGQQDVQQGQGEGGLLGVEGVMEPVGGRGGRRHRGGGDIEFIYLAKKR